MRRACILVATLALAGCNGGTVDRHSLTNDAAALDSINCEAWLLSTEVARDRVTTYYVREQAEELHLESSNFADALRHRPTSAGLEARVRVKSKKARKLADLLLRLHDHPTDRAGAKALAAEFKQAGSCS